MMINNNLCDRIQPQQVDASDAKHAHIIHNNTMQVLGRSREGTDSQNLPEIQVSLFENYENPVPKGIISLDDWLFSPQYQFIKEIEAIRAEQDKDRRRDLKSKLPAITPSGVCSKRKNRRLTKRSGIICMDVDKKDNPSITDFSAIKGTITNLKGLYYAGLSVSGDGLFLLFKVAYPKRHTEHFYALAADLKKRGLIVDPQCKDVARLRGASYDHDPFYNPLALPYEKLLTVEAKPVASTDMPDTGITAYRVGKLVEQIARTNTDITDNYNDWFAIGCSLAAEFKEKGRGWFHIISKQSTKYNPQECGKQYDHCLNSCTRTTIATFFGICKKYGLYAKSQKYENVNHSNYSTQNLSTMNIPLIKPHIDGRCSIFNSPIKNTKPAGITDLPNVYDAITSDRYKPITEHLRSIANSSEAYSYKCENFDFVAFGGIFPYRRDRSLAAPSGLLCVEIDAYDIENLFQKLLHDPKYETLLLFRSAWGIMLPEIQTTS